MILPEKDDSIVIVGAGCFGVSTAYHLLQRGYTNVTIIDRSTTLPAPDAASNDINRVVRSSYADKFYCELAREAIVLWKDKKWGGSYHESGVLVLGSSASRDSYTDEAYKNDLALGATVKTLNDGNALRSVFPDQVPTARFEGYSGYLNRDGGWANAGQGLALMLEEVKMLKGKVTPGKNVGKILRQPNGKTTGVQCDDGTVFEASLVIIATGSWTPSAFIDQLDLGRMCLATGQTVATIQLTAEEADIYRDCPVVVDFGASGFYVFPPNEHNVVKSAIHAAGYTYHDEVNSRVSTPRTMTSDPTTGLLVPKAALRALRTNLAKVYPDLAKMPFLGTRLCWYNDSPDGDWVISRYQQDDSLIVATAGSGHAYKFLPVIGGLIADLVENKLGSDLVTKFSISRKITQVDTSRSGQVQALVLNELNTPEDLQVLIDV